MRRLRQRKNGFMELMTFVQSVEFARMHARPWPSILIRKRCGVKSDGTWILISAFRILPKIQVVQFVLLSALGHGLDLGLIWQRNSQNVQIENRVETLREFVSF
jgi:hypothetical protein